MRKILVISHSSVLDINRKLYEGLGARESFQVKIVCPQNWEDKSLKRKYKSEPSDNSDIEIIPIKTYFTGNGNLHFYQPNALSKLKSSYRPDLIFLDEEPWALVTLQALLTFGKTKTLLYTKQNLIKRYPFPFRNIESWSYKKVKGFFAISKEACQVLDTKGNNKPIRILPHAFDSNVFFAKPEHSFPTKVFTIGYVGRLVKEKGVQDLLRAFRKTRIPENLKVQIRIVGSGQAEGELKELCSELQISEKVEFVGPVGHSEVGDQYRQLDLLVAPSQTTSSWKEQFGRMLIEAAACGVPVAASDSGEIPNVIESLQNGLIFKEKDHEDLCRCLEAIIHNPNEWNNFRDTGLKRVNELYSYPAITNTVIDFLNQ